MCIRDSYDPALILVALAGSELERAGRQQGLHVAREAFVDRVYEADGTLRSRKYPDSMILDTDHNLAQALSIVRDGYVIAHHGQHISLQAETICLHGDTPGAAAVSYTHLAAATQRSATTAKRGEPGGPSSWRIRKIAVLMSGACCCK